MSPSRRRLLQAIAAIPALSPLRSHAQAQSASKLHLRSGLVAYSYRKQLADKSMNYEDLIRRMADWGLDGLDCTVYWFPDNSREFLAKLRRTAYKNGIQIYNAGVRVSLAQPTPELRDAEVEKIKQWVDVADHLGAGHVRVFGGQIPKGATEQQAIGWAAEVMRRGAEYAGARGITVGVEDDGGLTTAAGPTVAIVRQADSPWAGINADSGNLRDHGYEQFESMLPYTTSVHLKREIAGPDGKMEPADWPRLFRMLGKAGYKGYVGLEYEGNTAEADVPGLVTKLVAAVRQVNG